MSIYDRDYAREDAYSPARPTFAGGFGFGWPRPPRAVATLLLANVVVFFCQLLVGRPFTQVFGLSYDGTFAHGRVWQIGTYMFLHGGPWHLILNMIGLYFCGSLYEQRFGRKAFLKYYFVCGLAGGLTYLVVCAIGLSSPMVSLIGASGAVYGLLAAAAVYFPQMQVIVLLFPVPIRVFAAIMVFVLLANALSPGGPNYGGEICHFGGAVAGVIMILLGRRRYGLGGLDRWLRRMPRPRRRWRSLAEQDREDEELIDRILAKISEHGLHSLTDAERRALMEATKRRREREREYERRFGRLDRL